MNTSQWNIKVSDFKKNISLMYFPDLLILIKRLMNKQQCNHVLKLYIRYQSFILFN